MEDYVHIDGTTESLVKIKGVVRIYYRGGEFKLPAYMWLPKRFPKEAPLVYMDPTVTMERNSRCPFVDANLMIHTDYLQGWEYPLSNLVDLYDELRNLFSDSPPLSQRREIHHANQIHQSPPESHAYAQSQARRDRYPIHQPTEERTSDGQDLERRKKEQLLSIAQAAMRESLAVRLKAALQECGKKDFEEQIEEQRKLVERSKEYKTRIQALSQERQHIDDCVSDFTKTIDKLDQWLQTEESKAHAIRQAARGRISPDAAIVTVDHYLNSILEADSCLHAVDDTVIQLDFALRDSKIGWEEYKKQLGRLAGYKFRAMMLKKVSQEKRREESVFSPPIKTSPIVIANREQKNGEPSSRPAPLSAPRYPAIGQFQGTQASGHEGNGNASVPNPLIEAARRMNLKDAKKK